MLDYTCGNRSYDLSSGYDHQGTDFFTYPYPWLKVEQSEVEVVAAAPGTLIYRHDGEYDQQCAMTGATSNSVVIRHADGTLAYYLHMKNGSLTPKGVGATIAAGEYLGVVASSGSSTGPHLHFEVRSADNRVLDPFHGACNASASLWAEQPPYYDSAVIAVHTGDAPPYRPACPGVETPHIEDHFAPDDTVYFRDHLSRPACRAGERLSRHPPQRHHLPHLELCQHLRPLHRLVLVLVDGARSRRHAAARDLAL